MKQQLTIQGAGIRISRPTESQIKVEIVKHGVVIHEFPVVPVVVTNSLTIAPIDQIQIEVELLTK